MRPDAERDRKRDRKRDASERFGHGDSRKTARDTNMLIILEYIPGMEHAAILYIDPLTERVVYSEHYEPPTGEWIGANDSSIAWYARDTSRYELLHVPESVALALALRLAVALHRPLDDFSTIFRIM